MKRIFTALVVACAVFTANAQVVRANFSAQKSSVEANAVRTTVSAGKADANGMAIGTFSKIAAPKKAEGVNPLKALYAVPEGSWIAGCTPGAGWYSVPFIYTPGRRDQVWQNYTSSEDKETPISYVWADDEGDPEMYEVTEDGDAIASVWGSVVTPYLTATQGDYEATYNIGHANDYGYGIWCGGSEGWENLGMAQFGTGNGVYSGFFARDLYTNTKGADYELDEKDNRIEGSEQPVFDSEIVGFAQRFTALNDFVAAKSAIISLCVDDNSNPAPLLGGTLTCTIYELTEDGAMGDVLMTATATDENCTPLSNWLYSFEFPFVEEDPLFGTIETPLYLEGKSVLVTFTGFENIATPFEAPFCLNDGFAAGGYMLLADGSRKAITYSNVDVPRLDYLITLTAAVPVLDVAEEMPEFLVIPAEGGYATTAVDEETGAEYNDFDVLTLTGDIAEFGVYTDDDNDWLTFGYDDQYADRGYMLFYFGTEEPLPEDVKSRHCVVTIDLFGKTIDIPVYQGEAPNAIESVVASNSKKSTVYNLAGQQVNGSFRGIAIKNGKKFIVK